MRTPTLQTRAHCLDQASQALSLYQTKLGQPKFSDFWMRDPQEEPFVTMRSLFGRALLLVYDVYGESRLSEDMTVERHRYAHPYHRDDSVSIIAQGRNADAPPAWTQLVEELETLLGRPPL